MPTRSLFPLVLPFDGCEVTATDPATATCTCADQHPCRHVREAAAELLPRIDGHVLEAEVVARRQELVDARHQLEDDRDGAKLGVVSADQLEASRSALEGAKAALRRAERNVQLLAIRRRAQGIGTPEEHARWDAEFTAALEAFGGAAPAPVRRRRRRAAA